MWLLEKYLLVVLRFDDRIIFRNFVFQRNPQFVALARSFYESKSTIQVIERTCSKPRTGECKEPCLALESSYPE